MICARCANKLRYLGDVNYENERPFFEWYSKNRTVSLYACIGCGGLYVDETSLQQLRFEEKEELERQKFSKSNDTPTVVTAEASLREKLCGEREQTFVRYTEKHNGKNCIPLKNAICGIDMTYWRLRSPSPLESWLEGDAADRLAAYEDIGLTPEEVRELLEKVLKN